MQRSTKVEPSATTSRSWLSSLCEKWLHHRSICVPKELGHLALCSNNLLESRFAPSVTHQSHVRTALGEPDVIDGHSHATSWRYYVCEYWLPHTIFSTEPVLLRKHELEFAFDAQGFLDYISKTTALTG